MTEDEKEVLISRLRHDLEDRERIIGALLRSGGSVIRAGSAGAVAVISKAEYLAPRQVLVRGGDDEQVILQVATHRLVGYGPGEVQDGWAVTFEPPPEGPPVSR
ncbi:MAG: hypothetical protein PHS14_17495 [Elusimicrobia bacterium]|nr:hypothetical protein [Elusimicrobiota bacterium]